MPKCERHLRRVRDMLCGMIILRILMFHEIGIMLKSPEDNHSTTILDSPLPNQTYRHGQTIQSDDSRTITKFVSQIHSLPTLLYVTFSHLKDFSRFETLLFPALDTFLQNDTYFVVLSEIWETKYHTELCTWNQTYSTYCQRIHPIFVDCPEGYFGPSPCCKQEKGLLQISNLNPNADWVVFMDDDVYLRSWHLRNFLSQFDPSHDVMLVTAGGKRSSNRILGQAEYSRYPLYHCSRNFNFTYPWGQPVIYSRAARQVLLQGWMAGGLVHQCREFKVTHDVGNAIFHWIYSLPVVHIRLFTHTTGGGGQSFGTHGVNHETAATLTGKKDIQSMYQVHDVFQSYEYPYQKLPIQWHNVTGFHTTKTYQTYGDPRDWGNTWHIVPYEDCWDGKKLLPTTSARLKRMEILRQKCANILDRLEGKKTSIDIQTPLKVFRIPCYDVFGKLQKPRRITDQDVVTLENDLASFPMDTPWLYFESHLS